MLVVIFLCQKQAVAIFLSNTQMYKWRFVCKIHACTSALSSVGFSRVSDLFQTSNQTPWNIWAAQFGCPIWLFRKVFDLQIEKFPDFHEATPWKSQKSWSAKTDPFQTWTQNPWKMWAAKQSVANREISWFWWSEMRNFLVLMKLVDVACFFAQRSTLKSCADFCKSTLLQQKLLADFSCNSIDLLAWMPNRLSVSIGLCNTQTESKVALCLCNTHLLQQQCEEVIQAMEEAVHSVRVREAALWADERLFCTERSVC